MTKKICNHFTICIKIPYIYEGPPQTTRIMKAISLLTLSLLALSGWSQNDNFSMDVSQLRAETAYFDIEGSPYLDDTYRLGHIFFRGEKLIFFFRFNALEDRVELKDRTTQLYHLQKNFILEPSFGAKTYKYVYYLEDENDLKKGYMVLLKKGEKISLLFKPKKIFKQAESPDHGYDTFSPPKYENVSQYYYQRGKELPRPVRLGKGPLLRLLKDKETELLKYITQQELDLSREQDAVQLIQYYNRIS